MAIQKKEKKRHQHICKKLKNHNKYIQINSLLLRHWCYFFKYFLCADSISLHGAAYTHCQMRSNIPIWIMWSAVHCLGKYECRSHRIHVYSGSTVWILEVFSKSEPPMFWCACVSVKLWLLQLFSVFITLVFFNQTNA